MSELPQDATAPGIICIGSVLWDIIGRAERPLSGRGDVAGKITRIPGGVAMNIAFTLAGFGMRPAVLTSIGCDPEGDALLQEVAKLGVDGGFAHRSKDLPTDCYMAVEDQSGLVAAIADAHSLEAVGDAILTPLSDGRLGSSDAPWSGLIALDGNLTTELLQEIALSPLFALADLRIAPASPGKAERLLPLMPHPRATLYVNLLEAGLLCQTTFASSREAAEALVAAGATRALVTDGATDASDAKRNEPSLTVPARKVQAQRITGAGDTFMAAHMFAESQGADRLDALTRAQAAAAAYVALEKVTP